jgi:NAD(P)H-dependent FMN reductase
MKIMLMAASTRKESVNKKLIQLVSKILEQQGVSVNLVDFADYAIPLYDGDMNESLGLPQNAKNFIDDMQRADGLILSVPEYNFSIPGTLKNLIDWVSRANPQPWAGQQIMLASASPSLVGGNRGLWATRIPLEACGSFVYPDMFSLANAYQAFKADGSLVDDALQQRLATLLEKYEHYLKRMRKE